VVTGEDRVEERLFIREWHTASITRRIPEVTSGETASSKSSNHREGSREQYERHENTKQEIENRIVSGMLN